MYTDRLIDQGVHDPIETLFARSGLRCTTQRRAIYETLSASTTHPTADQIFYVVGGRVKGMSLATVYNTLEAFCRAKLAKKVLTEGGSVRYDAVMHNHLHTICQKTGAFHDVPEELGQQLLDQLPREVLARIETALGFKIQSVQVQLVGEYITGECAS